TWKDDPRAGTSDVHVLYAGKISDRSVVLIDQADRAVLITQPSDDDGWRVEGTTRFDPVDVSPADLNDVLLLPAGEWTWLPLVHDAFPPRTLDGLVGGGADLKPGF